MAYFVLMCRKETTHFVILYAYYRIYAAAAAQLRSIQRGSKVMAISRSLRDGLLDGTEMTTLRIHRGGGGRSSLMPASQPGALAFDSRQSSLICEPPATISHCSSARSTPVPLPRRWKTFAVCRQRLSRVSRERKAAKTLGIVMEEIETAEILAEILAELLK